MEIKNSHILLIESSLNELHKIITDKDAKNMQLQKDNEYLKESLTHNKYEFESIIDENEKLKKQIKTLYEAQHELKQTIQEKDRELKNIENIKRQTEKLIQSRNDSVIHSLEEKIYTINEESKQKDLRIKELQNSNEHLSNIIEINNTDIEALRYDNSVLKKQIKSLKESNIHKDELLKREEYRHLSKHIGTRFEDYNFTKELKNPALEKLEQKLKESQHTSKKESDKDDNIKRESEEDLLRKSLGF